jgi:uncharacterized protein (TIRG00374 family)
MGKFYIGLISLVAGAAILGFVISAVGGDEVIRLFMNFSPLGIAPLLGLTFISHLLSAIKWQYVLRSMNIRVPLMLLFKIYLVGYAASYITPVVYVGGEFFLGYMLREKYNVSWRKALASVAIDKMLEAAIWISAIFAGAVLFFLEAGVPLTSKALMAGMGLIALFAAFIVIVFIFLLRKKSLATILVKLLHLSHSSFGKLLVGMEKDFFIFFSPKNKKYAVVILKLALLKYALIWLRNVFLIFYLAKTLSLVGGLISFGFLQLAYVLPIPGAVGAQEGILSLVFARIGFDIGTGTVFALLLRGAELTIVATGLFFLFRWGLEKFIFHAAK